MKLSRRKCGNSVNILKVKEMGERGEVRKSCSSSSSALRTSLQTHPWTHVRQYNVSACLEAYIFTHNEKEASFTINTIVHV